MNQFSRDADRGSEANGSRPTAGLLTILIMGAAGIAVGVPWAVFRYAPDAGIAPTWQVVLAAIGIIGGCAALNFGLRGLLPPRTADPRE